MALCEVLLNKNKYKIKNQILINWNGESCMKYGAHIVSVILSLVLAASLSYGDDSIVGETIAAKFLLDYDDHYDQIYKGKKKFSGIFRYCC